MPTPYKVAVVVGSLRKDSINRKVAHALTLLKHPLLDLNIVSIDNLTLYNQDLEENFPVSWTAFKNGINANVAVLFVTPEYNRSIPGVLKNAIDIGSRPPRQGCWDNKPAAIISASPGRMGACFSNHHLRDSLQISMNVMAQPEVYLGGANALFKDDGSLDDNTAPFVTQFLDAFAVWIEKFLPKSTI